MLTGVASVQISPQVTRNLNRIIDVNYYPVETARRSNMRHRPIGMGVQARARPAAAQPAKCEPGLPERSISSLVLMTPFASCTAWWWPWPAPRLLMLPPLR